MNKREGEVVGMGQRKTLEVQTKCIQNKTYNNNLIRQCVKQSLMDVLVVVMCCVLCLFSPLPMIH